MKKIYKIDGMSCMSCVAKVESSLLAVPDIISAKVDKASNSATVDLSKDIPILTLQSHLTSLDPKYSISQSTSDSVNTIRDAGPNDLSQYKPIFIIFGYITTVTLLIQYLNGGFDMMQWMRHFMAGFFLIFSFFKMLDLSGFSDSYSGYDIIARKWKGWAYIYTFIELGLGLAYLTNCCPLTTNVTAFIVMTVSIIGVLQSVLNEKKIQCACLGSVFDLPMSTVTIIEDGLMILMSGYMIMHYI